MQKKIILLLGITMLTSLLAACTAPTPVIELNPEPQFTSSTIGHNKPVALTVMDARPHTLEAQYAGANIDPKQNIAEIFTTQIQQALTDAGFSPVVNASADNKLTVRILSINYSVAGGYFSSNAETDVAAEVNAVTPKGSYQKTYYAHGYSDSYLAAQNAPSEQVNNAVNKLLNNIIGDHNLLAFLAN